ncbi:AmmeMemoRadiSam system protein B [Methanomicrobium antiquum]|uniref:MEMO1 family protein L1994_07745 n=1 Tax=Methanomicrobium antiquum TaxID=487686 RepID=A0AAF0JM03_9EURY|nr:AmmeMemoRadiSam system protein B [Methanomicrobium antiquum]MDD3976594.1 AmmeMemoRadiSam system protein B [Methanomicrobium sp.]WFN36040.1 AmmeMemoRadiSam system protein B [Methanomicrobium antiquum]
MVLRRATFAGMFYPDNPAHLKQILDKFFKTVSENSESANLGKTFGIVSPHAGIAYSGLSSAFAYSTVDLNFSGTFLVIGPSHSGYPDSSTTLSWETPLGVVENDISFSKALSEYIPTDDFVHNQRENSIEVQMPFIKYRFPNAKATAILMGNQSLKNAKRVSDAIYNTVSVTKSDVIVVASSDFSHYIPKSQAEKYDKYAIDALKDLNTDEFYRRIHDEGISACGYGPITAMVEYCRKKGAKKGRLLHYSTSGDITKDFSQVVGYAAISVE